VLDFIKEFNENAIISDMPPTKTYQPHCPADDCTGGHASRLHPVTAEAVHITSDILVRKQPRDKIFRCNYCGFVWFQSSSSPPGFNPTPAGLYGTSSNPDKFTPVSEQFKIRQENTPHYWNKPRQQRLKRRR